MSRFWNWLTASELQPDIEQRNYSVGDPALAEYLGLNSRSLAGISVTETSSLGLTAVYRAVSLISGTVAGLPLKSYRTAKDDTRQRVSTFLDSPHPELTQFEWVRLVLVHLLLHGNAYLLHIYNGAGAVVGLQPVHPSIVSVELDKQGNKVFKVRLESGEARAFSSADLLHIPALGTDGLVGLSPIQACREAIGAGLAADQAAARMFGNGLMLGGLVTADESLPEEDAKTVLAGLKSRMSGVKNAGDLAFVNASLKVQPWTITPEDAQFIESRQFQIEEVSRIFGVPPHLLSQTEKQTSWGTGVSEQNRGLSLYTLRPWTTLIEQRVSRLLSRPVIAEFDYKSLLQGSPEEEVRLLMDQVQGGLLTVDEARRIMNLPPLPTQAEAPTPSEDSDAEI